MAQICQWQDKPKHALSDTAFPKKGKVVLVLNQLSTKP
jgi:hypothetical protein